MINNKLEEHQINVCKNSIVIGKNLNLSKSTLENLAIAARFHDIGKLKIPENILNKNTKLTYSEMEIMKKHPEYSLDLINKNMNDEIKEAILFHHEMFNGKGYKGLKGNEIPLLARIISIADTYDAIISDRVYSKGKSHLYAINEIKVNSETQFDPLIVNAFIKCNSYIELQKRRSSTGHNIYELHNIIHNV